MGMFSQSQAAFGLGDPTVDDGEQVEGHLDFEDPAMDVGQEVQQFNDAIQAEVETMNEVQVRMKKAEYYNLLLQNPLFGPHEHPLATEVEDEIRGFVMERLRVFLGMAPDKKAAQAAMESFLDDEQKQAIVMWANKLLKRPAMYGLQGRKAAAEETPPAAPQVAMATLAPKPVVTPRVASAPAPAPVRVAAPAPRRAPVAQPRRQAPQRPQDDDNFEVMQHPVTGKMIKVSKTEQTKPQGPEQPKEMPVSGNFAGTSATPGANGGFVDMTGGRAVAQVSQAINQGNIGGMQPSVQGRLVDFFLKN